ncbi:MAG: glycosyltransferase, partial [Candidatus Marinimicrobia bacterium]|nr:glycosyltransferase [Candidatus Neomarinimicrobiota bacterium]MBT3947322.1 glycosyltransferase [Candidatus Neomarinimicrobiota bacterium]MBT4064745.1 glycosyltransferase [Candidatus Neomarinimicrobiota bacterium]MBT4453005.1 glycosyltransferase [Candidatus Neomarinimicrobiota bacterium]MBT5387063.1 glycosyltransferase [Candidatus Neomarinimicrobiota bacterium]
MEKKLNIFFSNSISAHKWGGGEKWMITAACGLKNRGHGVTVSGKANSVFLNNAVEAGLDIIPLNIYADYSPLKIWYTKRVLQRKQVDVIMLNLNKDIRVAGIAARMANVPVIVARNGIQLFSDKWKHKKTIGLVDGIIT